MAIRSEDSFLHPIHGEATSCQSLYLYRWRHLRKLELRWIFRPSFAFWSDVTFCTPFYVIAIGLPPSCGVSLGNRRQYSALEDVQDRGTVAVNILPILQVSHQPLLSLTTLYLLYPRHSVMGPPSFLCLAIHSYLPAVPHETHSTVACTMNSVLCRPSLPWECVWAVVQHLGT